MTFKITILGSNSAKPAVGKHCSAQVVNVSEQYYLVDCGEGTQLRLMECGISPMRIDHIFISHLHGDHVYGLFPLISSLGLLGRRIPLHIYAPAPMGEIIEQHFRFFDQGLQYSVEWHEVDTRKHQLIYQNKVLEVWSVPLRHSIPSSGFLFREKEPLLNIRPSALEHYKLTFAQMQAAKRGEDLVVDDQTISNKSITYLPYRPRSYAYLSDTNYSSKAAHLIEGVNLLYHEATYMDDTRRQAKERGHSTALQAARCAVEAKAERLIIGHFSSRYKLTEPLLDEARSMFANTETAQEGKTFSIDLQRNETDL